MASTSSILQSLTKGRKQKRNGQLTMKNVTQTAHMWITTYESQKPNLMVKWLCANFWRKLSRQKGPSRISVVFESQIKRKTFRKSALRSATFLWQVRVATTPLEKTQLITSTMEYKEPAVPTEHPRMRTGHFQRARLLLPKINAR